MVRRLLVVFIFASGLLAIWLAGNGSARVRALDSAQSHVPVPVNSDSSQFPSNAPLDWGSIDISTDINGDLVVTLENGEIRVVYKQSSNDWGVGANGRPSCIDEFFVKDLDKDVTDGGRFDNHLAQRLMTDAQVIYDGPDKKTVSMTWQSGAWEEVSIFPGSRVL